MNQSLLASLQHWAAQPTSDTELFVLIPLMTVACLVMLGLLLNTLRQPTDETSQSFQGRVQQRAVASASAAATPSSTGASPPTQAVAADVAEIRADRGTSLFERLRGGLAKTRSSLSQNLAQLFSGGNALNDDVLEQVHEVLFRADTGVKTSDKLVASVRHRLTTAGNKDVTWESVRDCLKDSVAQMLEQHQTAVNWEQNKPFVLLVVGVNGVGKTTTIGKLAAHFLANDKDVLLAAADTFRAAAVEQLQAWGDRLGVDVIKHKAGSDPAAVAYDAVIAAKSRNKDVLIIDTAGRLHSKNDLMEELGKINRVIGKDLPGAPHEVWLVIDATTGQNAFMQVKAFKEVVPVSGLIVTKLDGTAKGGVVIGVSDQFGLPIHYIGIGEKAADLRAFQHQDFAASLFE